MKKKLDNTWAAGLSDANTPLNVRQINQSSLNNWTACLCVYKLPKALNYNLHKSSKVKRKRLLLGSVGSSTCICPGAYIWWISCAGCAYCVAPELLYMWGLNSQGYLFNLKQSYKLSMSDFPKHTRKLYKHIHACCAPHLLDLLAAAAYLIDFE